MYSIILYFSKNTPENGGLLFNFCPKSIIIWDMKLSIGIMCQSI